MTKPKSQIKKVAAAKTEVKPDPLKAAAEKEAAEKEAAEKEAAEKEAAEKEAAEKEAAEKEAAEKEASEQKKKPKSKYPASIVKRAQEVFGSHEVEEIFFTSDENCFTIEQYAVMHGQNLKDQDVLTVKRSEV